MQAGVVLWVPPAHLTFVFFANAYTQEGFESGVVMVQPWLSPHMARTLYDQESLPAGRALMQERVANLDRQVWGNAAQKFHDFFDDAEPHFPCTTKPDSSKCDSYSPYDVSGQQRGPESSQGPATTRASPCTTDLGTTPRGTGPMDSVKSGMTTNDETPRLDYGGVNPMAEDVLTHEQKDGQNLSKLFEKGGDDTPDKQGMPFSPSCQDDVVAKAQKDDAGIKKDVDDVDVAPEVANQDPADEGHGVNLPTK